LSQQPFHSRPRPQVCFRTSAHTIISFSSVTNSHAQQHDYRQPLKPRKLLFPALSSCRDQFPSLPSPTSAFECLRHRFKYTDHHAPYTTPISASEHNNNVTNLPIPFRHHHHHHLSAANDRHIDPLRQKASRLTSHTAHSSTSPMPINIPRPVVQVRLETRYYRDPNLHPAKPDSGMRSKRALWPGHARNDHESRDVQLKRRTQGIGARFLFKRWRSEPLNARRLL
jgi:hypothetical protein